MNSIRLIVTGTANVALGIAVILKARRHGQPFGIVLGMHRITRGVASIGEGIAELI